MTVPKRRMFRFAFSLRTLFVVVTIFGVWLGYQLNWVNQRRAFLEEIADSEFLCLRPVGSFGDQRAGLPWSLKLLGEKPEYMIWLWVEPGESKAELTTRAQRLFPETYIFACQPGEKGN